MSFSRPTDFRSLLILRSVSPQLLRPVRFALIASGALAAIAAAKADDGQDCHSNRSDQAPIVCTAIHDQHPRSDTFASNQTASTPPAALQTRSAAARSGPAAPVEAASGQT